MLWRNKEMDMTPTKIVLEKTSSHFQLRVFAPETARGSTVIDNTPIRTGASLPGFRKQGARYAKRFSIPFIDQTS